jgi:hypothetical protein
MHREGEMFARQSDVKFTKLNALFADLQPKYQNFIMNAIDAFLGHKNGVIIYG